MSAPTCCPRCNHEADGAPVRFTFQGAAEFYCRYCEMFWQDFDYCEEAS